VFIGYFRDSSPQNPVRLAHKRLLDHVLTTFEDLEKTCALEYVFIVGYLGEQIKEYLKPDRPILF
jgi:NDP-sugar pyrophosphorylase family protein